MKKTIFVLVILALGFLHSFEVKAFDIPTGALDGGILHKQILSKYPTIDKYYYEPILYGAASPSPTVHIYIPIKEWKKLSLAQQNDLKSYASLATSFAKRDPLKYSEISPSAPIAKTILYYARNIGSASWVIYEGKLTVDGRDITQGKAVAQGK